eukprot:TRINITY_DN222_c4_g1_i1.p1 TRINITY_DN222_c4_g1~~TRINITY_DN222_c4_g1_i1.p1  ORF type:complete len:187 (+),score=63.19 TRINITY_DN222_c4_g1_i1:69-629(+)
MTVPTKTVKKKVVKKVAAKKVGGGVKKQVIKKTKKITKIALTPEAEEPEMEIFEGETPADEADEDELKDELGGEIAGFLAGLGDAGMALFEQQRKIARGEAKGSLGGIAAEGQEDEEAGDIPPTEKPKKKRKAKAKRTKETPTPAPKAVPVKETPKKVKNVPVASKLSAKVKKAFKGGLFQPDDDA